MRGWGELSWLVRAVVQAVNQNILAAVSTLVASILFAKSLRSSRSSTFFLALLVVPLLAIFFFSGTWRFAGPHEFLHASIVHNILNGFTPPEDILLAGYPLQYPWAHHYIVGWLTQLLHVSPSRGFALINIASLIISAVVIFKTSQLLKPSRLTGIFGVFLTIFGTSIFYLASLQFKLFYQDHRLIPYQKFLSANSNPLGFCLFSIFLFFIMRFFAYRGKAYVNALALLLSTTALAYFYPISWLAAMICGISICFGQIIFAKGRNWQLVFLTLLALFFGSMLAFPYMHGISSGKVHSAEIGLFLYVPNVLKRLSDVLLISLVPLLVGVLKRKELRTLFSDRGSEVVTLLWAGLGLLMIYAVALVPLNCEYKFLMQLMAVIGILSAPLVESLYKQKPLFVEVFIPLILLPSVLLYLWPFAPFQYDDPVYEKAGVIHHRDINMDRLYSWISNKTPIDTVVVDSFLTVPALGKRSLYVATDLRSQTQPHLSGWNGWGMSAKQMSEQVFGHQQDIQNRRTQNATALLTPHPTNVLDFAATNIKQEFKGREVIVIARDSVMKKLFDASPRFEKAFDGETVWVYTLRS